MQRSVSFLLSITSATALVITSSLIPSADAQRSSGADQEARHRKCLEANDYQGCMNFDIDNNSQVPLPEQGEDCDFDGIWCTALPGRDVLGEPKLKGWRYRERSEEVWYINPTIYKVKVRGSYGRYISSEDLLRTYHPAQPAKPGHWDYTYEEIKYDCKTGSKTIWGDCSRTEQHSKWIPGEPAKSAWVGDELRTAIIDCDEKTIGWHSGLRLKGKWKSLSTRDGVRSGNYRQIAKDYCGKILSLPQSTFMKYVK